MFEKILTKLKLFLFKKENRPWGFYKVLLHKDNKKIKEIVINTNQKLSLQKHLYRNEYWCFTQGFGKITINNDIKYVEPGSVIYIPYKTIHRVENIGKIKLVFIEVATGNCIDENDIIRFDDIYGRIN